MMREDYAAVQAACGVVVASIGEDLQREGGGRTGQPGGSYFMGKGGGGKAEACGGIIKSRCVEALWEGRGWDALKRLVVRLPVVSVVVLGFSRCDRAIIVGEVSPAMMECRVSW